MKLTHLFAFVAVCLLASCGTHRRAKASAREYQKRQQQRTTTTTKTNSGKTETLESTSKTTVYTDVVQGYIADYDDIAIRQMQNYGIPASIILAQGILESGAGRGTLVKKANNHFGIKCHAGWNGKSVYHDDDRKGECFRKYDDPEQSFMDHSEFLTGRSRYASLFDLDKTDYKRWAKGLRAAGYATDPKYPQKLISIIEKYNLSRYDYIALGEDPGRYRDQRTIASNEKVHVVQKGDTLYSLSKKYNVTVDELKRLNGLKNNNLQIGQELYFN